MIKSAIKSVLICPLDWGLGHATRSELIAQLLIRKGSNVTIAATSSLLNSINEKLPVKKLEFKSIRIRYSSAIPQYLAILVQLPIILIQAFADHYRINRIIKKHDIDIVISDNRFGLWNNKSYTVYITHLLTIKTKPFLRFLEPILSYFHGKVIERYNECWVPDLPGEPNLAGALSHPGKMAPNCRYIGLLSRLRNASPRRPYGIPAKPFISIILSGPEPQRTILEKKITHHPSLRGRILVVVAGQPLKPGLSADAGSSGRYGYLNADEMKYIIRESDFIICRSGYSTLMDLSLMERTALLIPTPGQTEQEYLAGYLSDKGWFTAMKQSDLEGDIYIETVAGTKIPSMGEVSRSLLDEAINRLLDQDHRQEK